MANIDNGQIIYRNFEFVRGDLKTFHKLVIEADNQVISREWFRKRYRW